MKTKLLCLASVLAMLFVLPGTAGASLLVNPSFEIGPDEAGMPSGWGLAGSATGDAWLYIEDQPQNAQHGSKFIQLGPSSWSVAYQHNRPVNPGDECYMEAYIRDTDGATTGMSFKFEFYSDWLEIPYNAEDIASKLLFDTGERQIATAGDGQWANYTDQFTAPAGAVTWTPVIVQLGDSPFYVDNAWADIAERGARPIDPVPANGSSVSHNNLTELRWRKPPPFLPGGTVTCDIYLDPNEYRVDIMDPAVKLNVTPQEPNWIAVTVEPETDYYWLVVCFDDDGTKAPVENRGLIWAFSTKNATPVVDAGINQGIWLPGVGTASVNLTGVITDDGLPDPPAGMSYTWALASGPAGLVSNSNPSGTVPGNGIVPTTVEFDTAGTYVITLSADDEPTPSTPPGLGKVGSDTVLVHVYASDHSGLIAHWPFNNRIILGTFYNDIVGGHHGTPVGNPARSTDSQVGAGCLYVDGEGSYVDITDSGTTDPNYTTWASPPEPNYMSVTAWIKSDGDFDDAWAGFVCKGTQAWRIQREGDTDNVEFSIAPTGWAVSGRGGTIDKIDDSKWHHIAGVFTGNGVNLYVDGCLAESNPMELPVVTGGANIWIGAGYSEENPDVDYHFKGYIDEVRLYDVILSHDKIVEQFRSDGGANSCCGVYMNTDFSQDCYTGIEDLVIAAADWLYCNDVTAPCSYPYTFY